LARHNAGMTESLRPCIPFDIVCFEEFVTREEVIKREKYFKTSGGRTYLKSKLVLYFNARPADASYGDKTEVS
jgi:putative endonuclease